MGASARRVAPRVDTPGKRVESQVIAVLPRRVPGTLGRRLTSDRGNAYELPPADVPALAASLAPDNSRADADRVAAIVGNANLDFAIIEIHVVDQADTDFGDVTSERRVSLAVVRLDGNGPEERLANFGPLVGSESGLGLEDELVNCFSWRD